MAAVKALAIESRTIADAERSLKDVQLADVFRDHPKHTQAWNRGRFLRNLAGFASTPVTIPEAEIKLDLEHGQLQQMIETDPEVCDTWNQTRIEFLISVKKAVGDKALEGKAGAAKLIEGMLRDVSTPKADVLHVPIDQMCELCGITRQTLHDWYKNKGLQRNSDNTFNLKSFIEWYGGFVLEKNKVKAAPASIDPMRDLKAQRLQIDIQEKHGQLLDRNMVVSGLMARQQALVNALNKDVGSLAMRCHGQTIEKISEVLESFFEDVRRQQCQLPEELTLPEDVEKQLLKLLDQLNPEGE